MKLQMIALVLAFSALAKSVFSGELPVKDGLFFHFDAGAQKEARAGAALPPMGNLQPADIALDSSSNHWVSFQAVAERRPVYVSDGEAAYLKFDGKDDFLCW